MALLPRSVVRNTRKRRRQHPSAFAFVAVLSFNRDTFPRKSCVTAMPVFAQTTLLLIGSNVFMTFAWYAHLKNLSAKPWYIAALLSWGIALFEYLLQVPANRIGYTEMSLGQLKILQEVITLSVFVPFALFYMHEPFKWDYVWAALCLLGAVFFIFRS